MKKDELKIKLNKLRSQLDSIISEIQTERQESKDDEINVIDELMMHKGVLEQEIDKLQNAYMDMKDYPDKKYVIKQNGNVRKISLVNDSIADSTNGLISEACPLGQALRKARVGDKFKITTPIGEAEYSLLEIE
jgi:transcription elongation GreA/GreB family factor